MEIVADGAERFSGVSDGLGHNDKLEPQGVREHHGGDFKQRDRTPSMP